jgi:PKD repeat protein
VQLTGPAGEYDFDGATGPQGFTPTGANPGRQYLSAGTYTVLYRANAGSASTSTGLTITVYPKPVAAFTITEVAGVAGTVGVATGCAPLTVKFPITPPPKPVHLLPGVPGISAMVAVLPI